MWKWIRIPKGIALLAFLLPWMTVSCSDQKLVEASGFGLAFGRVTAMGQASQLVLGTSVAALLLIIVGTWRYSKDTILAEAAKNDGGAMDQAALAMIQVNWHFGYWLALLSLIAAAAMAWLVMSGKEAEAEAKMRSLAADATGAAKGAAAQASDAIDAAKDKKDDEPPKAP